MAAAISQPDLCGGLGSLARGSPALPGLGRGFGGGSACSPPRRASGPGGAARLGLLLLPAVVALTNPSGPGWQGWLLAAGSLLLAACMPRRWSRSLGAPLWADPARRPRGDRRPTMGGGGLAAAVVVLARLAWTADAAAGGGAAGGRPTAEVPRHKGCRPPRIPAPGPPPGVNRRSRQATSRRSSPGHAFGVGMAVVTGRRRMPNPWVAVPTAWPPCSVVSLAGQSPRSTACRSGVPAPRLWWRSSLPCRRDRCAGGRRARLPLDRRMASGWA